MKKQEPQIPKKTIGRPKANIDWKRVGEMVEAGCTSVGIAATIGIDEATLRKRCAIDNKIPFSEYCHKKRASGDEILREVQFKTAREGNVTMQIWLGKQRLAQSDKSEVTNIQDAELTRLRGLIAARAQEKGVSEADEIKLFVDDYADRYGVKPEIRQRLLTESVQ